MVTRSLERMARERPEVSCVGAVCDDEWLPLQDASMDLVTSSMLLHWSNDLHSSFGQVKRALRPDGLFIGAMLGGDTLIELRRCLHEIEEHDEVLGASSPHLSPLAGVPDVGNVLTKCGFSVPTIDQERIRVVYPSAMALFRHLHEIGEGNAVAHRRTDLAAGRRVQRAAKLYEERHREPGAKSPTAVPATFHVVHWVAWAPGPKAARPARRGAFQSGLNEKPQEKPIDGIESLAKEPSARVFSIINGEPVENKK